MSKTNAEYMRAYRARKKVMPIVSDIPAELTRRDDRIAELEAEVKHLKAELAKRPTAAAYAERMQTLHDEAAEKWQSARAGFNSRPFTPAPKKGK